MGIGDKYIIEIDSVIRKNGTTLYGVSGTKSCLIEESELRRLPRIKDASKEKHNKQVGDEVFTGYDSKGNYLDVGIVLSVDIDTFGEITVISKSGHIYGIHDPDYWRWTGRNLGLADLLKEMGNAE